MRRAREIFKGKGRVLFSERGVENAKVAVQRRRLEGRRTCSINTHYSTGKYKTLNRETPQESSTIPKA